MPVDCGLTWTDADGAVHRERRGLPGTPTVEDAVSIFAHGTMLQDARGPIAVEDLRAGDRVRVLGGRLAAIVWIGSRGHAEAECRPVFYRVAGRAFGARGPDADILLGASARILIDDRRCEGLVGRPLAFAPLAAFEDGRSVCAVRPRGEATVYGIGCRAQEALLAGGLPVESAHPARATGRRLTPAGMAELAWLFPQLAAGVAFGASRIPCLSRREAMELALARR